MVELRADVLGQKPQHKVPVFLQQGIFAAVAAIRLSAGKVLAAVEFDDQAGSGVKQVNFHVAPAVKRDWQFHVQRESASRFGKRLQSAVEESLG